MKNKESASLDEQLQPVVRDVERIVGLHMELLKCELQHSAAEIPPALASIGAGAGLATVGGLFGTLALVHGLQRSTRLPLWGCYGIVGGLLGAAGISLMGSGRRRLSAVSFVPHETLAALQEDFSWVKGTMT